MKKTFIISALAIVFSSCLDMLNISPENEIGTENMWTTEDLADKGMAGLYFPFYSDQLNDTQLRRQTAGLNRQGIEAMGFCTDYFSNNYPVELLSLATKRADDFQVWFEWKFCYTIIHACNNALAGLGKANLPTAKYNRYLCEARFVRAWAYRRLNMLYQGVPVYLEPIINKECIQTQESAERVWQVVIDDLTWCIDNPDFPDNTLTDNYGRPSKGAAYSLRGMVYMWQQRYDEAIADFSKVEDCGYGLWTDRYIEFFKFENEKHQEMIFPLQFDEESGYCDNIQKMVGARDNYDCWTEIKPSADFVDYYKNADGSDFKWKEVPGLEDWELLTPAQREIFFCRDGLESVATQKSEVIRRVTQAVYDTYYLNTGNEARIKNAYNNRDPRLKQTVVTPYEPVDCYKPNRNGDNPMIGKQARWPLVEEGTNGGDFWLDKRTSAFYCYRKYNEFEKGRLIDRQRCHTDWPLIRYTDVLLQHAEALAQKDRIGEAINLVNRVRTRAGMPLLTQSGTGPCAVTDKDDMIERIRYERRVEFCVEGINFFDEIRWGTYKQTKFQGQDINGGKSWWGDIVEYNWYYTDYMWPWTVAGVEY
ncbi:MAG: RagB/SusD family nutrient uptake outer membrane protein, partial [Dysgonamonadaceae bacterium]|nr:RagB/SusD family nutrient uptake outer membrane protein [Dysgonamonadaceae bacterium]